MRNPRVLVVGASSGIGRATALLFAREGARVIASARRAERLKELEAEIVTFPADAGDPAACQRLADFARERMGGVDVLVYAAGTNTKDRSLARLTVPLWDELLRVNLSGAYYVTRAVLPGMRAAGNGHLIYVSSVAAHTPDASGAAYQAAKRGLLGLAHAVRVEEKEHGIRTCVVCPGMAATEMLLKRPVKTPDDVVAKALRPEDVAEMIVAVARLDPRAAVPELEIVPARL
ncbi:MAG: SDR family oxidoreductase [Bryobacteraceae bacterium]